MSVLCCAQKALSLGESYNTDFVPRGAMRYCSNLNFPSNASYAKMISSVQDVWRRLRTSYACGTNSCHSCVGKLGSILHIPTTKWHLKSCMAFSAALPLWLWGSTKWNAEFSSHFIVENIEERF